MAQAHKLCFKIIVLTFSLAFHLLPTAPARAHGDVFLAMIGGQVTVGGANELGTIDENYDLTTRLFEGVMVANFPPFSPADYGRNEPGFFALANASPLLPVGASALPGSASVAVHVPPFMLGGNMDSLFFWNGAGAIDFQPVATLQPGVGLSLDTNPIGSTSASGELHVHATFEIDNGAAGVPNDGVYLAAPTVSVGGLADSERFYMVWLVDALIVDEEAAEEVEAALESGTFEALGKSFSYFEEAVDYVHNNLVVPEPTAGVLILMACFGGAFGRRRRQHKLQEAPR